MSLQFNPPSWLIQDYYNSKRPVENLADTLRQISRDVLEQRQANRRDMLADQEMKNRQESNRIAAEQVRQKGLDQFTDSANPAFLPKEMQAGFGQPVQGPVTEAGVAPMKEPTIAWAEEFARTNPGGYKGIAARKTQAETEKDLAMAEYYRNGKPPSPGKHQYRVNPITGEVIEIMPSPAGAPATVNTLTPATGQAPYRDVAKAKGAAAEEASIVDSVIGEIDRAASLNKRSRGGVIGAAIQKGQSALNVGTDSPEFTNTADVINTMKAQVARVLKSTFGGQLSDDERRYLNEVYGAVEKMTPAERGIAMQNVKTMLIGKRQATTAKYNALAGGAGSQNPSPSADPLGIR